MSKRKVFGFLSVVALLVTAAVVLGGGKESLGDASSAYLACFDRRDAECMMRYATRAEIQATNLSTQGLQQLLDEWVSPYMKGSNPMPYEDRGMLAGNDHLYTERRFYRFPGEVTFTFSPQFFLEDGRPRTTIVSPLIEMMQNRLRKKPGPTSVGEAAVLKDLHDHSDLLIKGCVTLELTTGVTPAGPLPVFGARGPQAVSVRAGDFYSWQQILHLTKKKYTAARELEAEMKRHFDRGSTFRCFLPRNVEPTK